MTINNLPLRNHRSPLRSAAVAYPVAMAFVAISGVTAMWLEVRLGLREPSLIFLFGVLMTAVVGGLGPSLMASAASFLVYDYFFTEPYNTLKISDPQDLLSIIVFLVVAVLTSHLTARIRSQAIAAEARESRLAALYAFARETAAASRFEDLLAIISRHIGEQFQASTMILLADQGEIAPRAAYPPGVMLPQSELDAARFAWAEGRSAPMALLNSIGRQWVHVSIGTIRGEVAVLSLKFPAATKLSPENEQLLDAFTQQAGVAVERLLLGTVPAGNDAASAFAARVRALERRIEDLQRDLLALRDAAHDILKPSSSGNVGAP